MSHPMRQECGHDSPVPAGPTTPVPTPPGLLDIDTRTRGTVTTLRIRGEIDVATHPQLTAALAAATGDPTDHDQAGRELLLDLREVTFIDAHGVRVLADTLQRAALRGDVVTVEPGPAVRDLLEMLGRPGTGPAPPRRRADEYAHLAPLFDQRRDLPADHPHQQVLRTALITGHLPVAQHIARKYRHRGENLDDLEQVATIGLIHAVDRFDPDRGVDFLAYAIPTIDGEVLRHYRDRTATIRIPRRIRELQMTVLRATDDLRERTNRAPRPTEIAAYLDIPLSEVIEALDAGHRSQVASLDEPTPTQPASAENTRYAAALAVTDPDLAGIVDHESLGPLLDALPEREQRIVLLRFYGNQTQSQIAAQVGISQMHVSRLLTSSLAQLRESLTAEPPPATP